MVIDPNQLEENAVMNFKGGQGEMDMRAFVDSKCRIMRNILKPGAGSGEHIHDGNSEIILVLNGTLTFYFDGRKETVSTGQIHYCPMGHRHYFINETDTDVVFFAVVPEHH